MLFVKDVLLLHECHRSLNILVFCDPLPPISEPYVVLLVCLVSWQYQKYWTILILVLCLLCVTPLVCSSYSGFAPHSPFYSSWWQRNCELSTNTLDLQGFPSTSSRESQTTHVFADSRFGLLCHALRICVAHAPPGSCPSFLLVHWAFLACYRNCLPRLHHASLPQN